jgi:hypothetical protein
MHSFSHLVGCLPDMCIVLEVREKAVILSSRVQDLISAKCLDLAHSKHSVSVVCYCSVCCIAF